MITTYTVTDNKTTVGQQIKLAMNERGLKISELVTATGVADTTVRRILNDGSYDVGSLRKLIRYLGVTVHIYP